MLFALALTAVAGGATSVGAVIGLLGPRGNQTFLASALGLSAGVMLYISFVEMLPKGAGILDSGGAGTGWIIAPAAFVGGMVLTAIIDRLVPEPVNPHARPDEGAEEIVGSHRADEPRADAEAGDSSRQAALLRTGTMMAVLLAIHNVPEGFATFVAALQDPRIALPVVVAIALHNIPEGISVAVPIYEATGSRSRGFWMATVSGLAEPAGALLGALLLAPLLSGPAMGAILAGVAGVMVFVTLDKLLPAAQSSGSPHAAMYSLIGGMALMAGTLVVLG